jgi:hypothetical protein
VSIILFSFSLQPETQEAAYAGNIGIQQALQILQGLTIADAVNKARETEKLKEGYEASQLKAEKEVSEEEGVQR